MRIYPTTFRRMEFTSYLNVNSLCFTYYWSFNQLNKFTAYPHIFFDKVFDSFNKPIIFNKPIMLLKKLKHVIVQLLSQFDNCLITYLNQCRILWTIHSSNSLQLCLQRILSIIKRNHVHGKNLEVCRGNKNHWTN